MTGEQLRQLRKRAGFTATALASILGYRVQRWSAFENDRAVIPPVVEYAARWVCENELTNNNRSQSATERAVELLISRLGLPREAPITFDQWVERHNDRVEF